MDERWFQVIIALIPVMGTIITAFLVPWIREKIGAEKLKKYAEWAEYAVKCAEQIYTKDQWKEKKEYCVTFLSDLIGGALTPAQLEVLIEATVKELRLTEKAVE